MTLERNTRTRLTSGMVLFLVLAAGVILGVALDRTIEARNVAEARAGVPEDREGAEGRRGGRDTRRRDPADEGERGQRRRPLIVDQVGLTEAQRQQVDSIVRFFGGQMRALHQEFDEAYNPRYREILLNTRTEVRNVLNEEQRTAYDSLLAERDRRREEGRRDSVPGLPGRGRPDGNHR